MTNLELLKILIKNKINEIKQWQIKLQIDENNFSDFGGYDECGDSYRIELKITQGIINVLIKQKISLEKYYKKLRYEEGENK
jgi:hypothetical protein